MAYKIEDLKKLHAIWQIGSDDAAADASNDIMEALPGLLAEVERLSAKTDALEERLAEIGDFAHHQSTGPAIPDAFWSIRDMAYGAVETSSERMERVRHEVSMEAKP